MVAREQEKNENREENYYMKDYIVRATAADGQIRAFAALQPEIWWKTARKRSCHQSGSNSGTGTTPDSRSNDGRHDERMRQMC